MHFQKPYTRFVCSNKILMTFKECCKRYEGEGADVYQRYKQFQHLKKCNIARNIMCFFMNVTMPEIFFSPSYLFSHFELNLLMVFKLPLFWRVQNY